MKYTLLILFAILFVLQISSCDCDGDYIEEARCFEKDTALMYVWLYDNSPAYTDYIYFKENGDYRSEPEKKYLEHDYGQVWYVKDSTIYYRGGGEIGCTVSENLLFKYKVRNETLFSGLVAL